MHLFLENITTWRTLVLITSDATTAVREELPRSTQIALEARQTAAVTLGSLQEQGNQLKRVNRDVDDVRSSMPCWVCLSGV